MRDLPAYSIWFVTAIGLTLLSFLWPSLVGGSRAYSDEAAQEYQLASRELYNQIHASSEENSPEHEHPPVVAESEPHHHPPASSTALEAARKRFDLAKAKRDAALTKGSTTATLFRYISLFCIVVGTVVYLKAG